VTPRRDPYFVVTVRELNLRSNPGYPDEYRGESNPVDRDVIPLPNPADETVTGAGAAAGFAVTAKVDSRPDDRIEGDAIKSSNKITGGSGDRVCRRS
jgi:hypothetical protein